MNKVFSVLIISATGEILADCPVIARSQKRALLHVIEAMPENHKSWQAPGWRDIQVYEANKPVFLTAPH